MGTRRGSGEGQLPPGIRQRGDGRYEGRVRVNGKQVSVYGRTPEEAYLALQELKSKVGAGWQPPQPLTVAQLLEQWMASRPQWKPRTRHDYQELAERWVLPTIGKTHLTQLQPRRIEALLKGLPTRQAAKAHAMLRAAFRAAYRWGIVEVNPLDRVEPPAYRPQRKELPPPEAVAQALQSGQHHPWWPWVALAVATGMRPGEQAALRWEDWSPEEGLLWVRRSGQYIGGTWVETPPKTYAGDRRITLPPLAQAALQLQRERVPEHIPLVFPNTLGRPYYDKGINAGIKRFCRATGLPPLTPHQLRHYHASLLIQQGLPLTLVSRRLGHASPEITARIYAHWLGESDALAAEAVSRALG